MAAYCATSWLMLPPGLQDIETSSNPNSHVSLIHVVDYLIKTFSFIAVLQLKCWCRRQLVLTVLSIIDNTLIFHVQFNRTIVEHTDSCLTSSIYNHLLSYWFPCLCVMKKVECLRAAVELTRRLLTQCGQGITASSQAVQHTVYSLQVKRLLYSYYTVQLQIGHM